MGIEKRERESGGEGRRGGNKVVICLYGGS